ncbi:nuclear transport factor 2 family protein [Myxococcota bacterium]|nr:nuclear transport factor 2 family protein [Myxococcota bacterium]
MVIDPSNTWKLVEQQMNAETDPRRRRNLELVLAHMKCEAQADVEGVVATLTESPRYIIHSNPEDRDMNPSGSKDAVRGFYDRTIVQTGAHHLEFACDRVIVDDHSVFTEGIMRQVYPGATLRAMKIEVDDPDAYYFTEYRMGVVWPVDHDEDRLTGEEVYAGGDPFQNIAQRKIALSDIKAI